MDFKVAAVVVAAGQGARAGSGVPKQYRRIFGEPVLRKSLSLFSMHKDVAATRPVIRMEDAPLFATAAAGLKLLPPVQGGATRQASVLAGLAALESERPDVVLVHDAARPFASAALVSRAIAAGRERGAAIPVLDIADTVKTVDGAGTITGTQDRSSLRMAQTPQAFRFDDLLAAHRRAQAEGRQDFSDDAALAEWAGLKVSTFAGEAGNVKLTTDADFARAEAAALAALGDVRTGYGVDVHAFGPGDHVMLGGVRIAHGAALTGHSDADVALHALVDAILGALADGDIGTHFPPSDPQWRGVSSDRFLLDAAERVHGRGGVIAHLDLTIVCEAPRIAPAREAMRARIAEIARISIGRVAVKATTSEKLGFTGRGEGIAAFATATVRLPWSMP
jgi:2-C-methyl-D-erythritol 4-phosphate cytidylyltransferase/2-C-methyl-D-erythritol 2,4-cyclodiphosphate synthase